jgi:hypothetical protein
MEILPFQQKEETMSKGLFSRGRGLPLWIIAAVVLTAGVFTHSDAWAKFNVKVIGVNTDGTQTEVKDFRWLVQEDATYQADPTAPTGDPTDPPIIRFHASYMPVAQSGAKEGGGLTIKNTDGSTYYYLSVMPRSGYALGGAKFKGNRGNKLEVFVNELPLPTAQISIFVFNDNNPINNAPDIPAEIGLEGFRILLEDAGGRYGLVGGQMTQDAFGMPLGTTYFPVGSPGCPGPFDPETCLDTMGDSNILTDADGVALIKNLAPGKYGIQIVPPDNNAGGWQQTTTIEGSKVIDAWVKNNEPTTMVEFGMGMTHIFAGFVQQCDGDTTSCDDGDPGLTGGSTISGEIANWHFARPPWTSGPAPGHTLGDISQVWIGLNDANGRGIYAKPVEDGTFSIAGVPDGLYTLVSWDTYLLHLIWFTPVTVSGGNVDLGKITVPEWFAHVWNFVFFDGDSDGFPDALNEDGFPVAPEQGMLEQNINIRFRDGTIYQAFPTDGDGYIPFDKVFPFFSWLVAEVDFARFKATGVTVVADEGGKVLTDFPGFPHFGRLTPQAQPDNGGASFRTETGVVLTQGFQTFASDTNVLYWGKNHYPDGEHGGISGMVFNEATRAEDDPRMFAAEEWEPGVARIQVNLYRDSDGNGVIDNVNGKNGIDPADVDNHPFGWSTGGKKGKEDVDHHPGDKHKPFDAGDAVQITWTDSWDDSQPTDCPGDPADPFYNGGQCYDGLRNFNQVRPGVFDGGYAFDSIVPAGVSSGDPEVVMPVGAYIVEVTRGPHQVYEHRVEEAKNVDYGDEYVPSILLLPVSCVGEPHTIPPYLTLFGDWDKNGACDPGEECVKSPFVWVAADPPGSGDADDQVYDPSITRPLCNRKQVTVQAGFNAAADFALYTDVPVAAQFTGLVTNDLGVEMNPGSKNFIEKFAVPYLPISIRDWTGREVARVYTDVNGIYNGLVSSTYTANVASPSGFAAAMYSVCINDPGPDGDDFFYRRDFIQSCYTMQFMPGTTTYLDTPVLPSAAFAGDTSFPLDCEYPDGTPVIAGVEARMDAPFLNNGFDTSRFKIYSVGKHTDIRNPAYNPLDPASTEPPVIEREYGFGADRGIATISGPGGDYTLNIGGWTSNRLKVRLPSVPGGVPSGRYKIMVTKADGTPTPLGTNLTIGPWPGAVHSVSPGGSIQAAIDAASDGDLILVKAGTYKELPIVYKDVILQGSGAPSTVINAETNPVEIVQQWQDRINAIVDPDFGGDTDFLLADQIPNLECLPNDPFCLGPFEAGAHPGITVLGRTSDLGDGTGPTISGFSVRNASVGGAVFLNGNAEDTEVSGNWFFGNWGAYGGGIRLGHPVTNFAPLADGHNDDVLIHNNRIFTNGATLEGRTTFGGGISLYQGSDNYEVSNNDLCGNFSIGGGGGIGHQGYSDGGLISHNRIYFNQQFHQTVHDAAGGGIAIEGPPPDPALGPEDIITPGSGSVVIDGNLILGNHGGTGDGAGIRLNMIDGSNLFDSGDPHRIDITNNMIVNNVAGLTGGGISIRDAADVHINHNTIANNDSTATGGEAFIGPLPGVSTPYPGAGIVSRANTPAMAAESGQDYPDPELYNNIVYQNRSMSFDVRANCDPPGSTNCTGGLVPDLNLPGTMPVYSDLAVIGTAGSLSPVANIITSDGIDPQFVSPYHNGPASNLIAQNLQTVPEAAAALDEGGNFVDLQYGPRSLAAPDGTYFANYHLQSPASPPVDAGNGGYGATPPLAVDFDGEARPLAGGPDIGADEVYTTTLPPPGGGGGTPAVLVFADPNGLNMPIARRTFGKVLGGTLTWEFDFNWDRDGSKKYALYMQLGDSSVMSDASVDAGVAVNLVWTKVSGPGKDHEWLATRNGSANARLVRIDKNTAITVNADLGAGTYTVMVDGVPVGGAAFDTPPPTGIDTVRFIANQLPANKFKGQAFDNVSVSLP